MIDTFSGQIKSEILATFDHEIERYILLGVAFLTNGHFHDRMIYLKSASKDLIELLAHVMRLDLGLHPEIKHGRTTDTVQIKDAKERSIFRRFLREEFGCLQNKGALMQHWLDPSASSAVGIESDFSPPIRVLQSLYLAGGSVHDPSKAYCLELWCRSLEIAHQCQTMLKSYGIDSAIMHKGFFEVIYLKDGERLGDFLVMLGAHEARLKFEDIRMHRDLKNHVNRVVNCDTANSKRLAEASARQLQLLNQLKRQPIWDELSDAYKDVAEKRLAYPDISLREMGDLFDPPLGKSAVNYRLKKLEMWAKDADDASQSS